MSFRRGEPIDDYNPNAFDEDDSYIHRMDGVHQGDVNDVGEEDEDAVGEEDDDDAGGDEEDDDEDDEEDEDDDVRYQALAGCYDYSPIHTSEEENSGDSESAGSAGEGDSSMSNKVPTGDDIPAGVSDDSADNTSQGDICMRDRSPAEGQEQSDKGTPSDAGRSNKHTIPSSKLSRGQRSSYIESSSNGVQQDLSSMRPDANAEDIEMSEAPPLPGNHQSSPVVGSDQEMESVQGTEISPLQQRVRNPRAITYSRKDTNVNRGKGISMNDSRSLAQRRVENTASAAPKLVIDFGVDTSNLAPLTHKTNTPTPKLVIDFGVDTSNLEPFKRMTDTSQAGSQALPTKAQSTEEAQSEPQPAFQSTADKVTVADRAPLRTEDPPITVHAGTTIETTSREKLKAPTSSLSPSKFQFDTEKTIVHVSEDVPRFDPGIWADSFNFRSTSPVKGRRSLAPTNKAHSSKQDRFMVAPAETSKISLGKTAEGHGAVVSGDTEEHVPEHETPLPSHSSKKQTNVNPCDPGRTLRRDGFALRTFGKSSAQLNKAVVHARRSIAITTLGG